MAAPEPVLDPPGLGLAASDLTDPGLEPLGLAAPDRTDRGLSLLDDLGRSDAPDPLLLPAAGKAALAAEAGREVLLAADVGLEPNYQLLSNLNY